MFKEQRKQQQELVRNNKQGTTAINCSD